MLARTIRQSLIEGKSGLPPAFLLPLRARCITTESHSLETGNVPDPLVRSGHHISRELKDKVKAPKVAALKSEIPSTQTTTNSSSTTLSTTSNTAAAPNSITDSVRLLLPLLHAQAPHYLTIHLHGRPYLITQGDTVRLPFLMPRVRPGDILRLNRATHIGSRDFTLKAPAPIKGTRDGPKQVFYLDERLFECRATVIGVESEPMRVKEKTKRRQRHIKRVKTKLRYTILKISEIKVKGLEEFENEVESANPMGQVGTN